MSLEVKLSGDCLQRRVELGCHSHCYYSFYRILKGLYERASDCRHDYSIVRSMVTQSPIGTKSVKGRSFWCEPFVCQKVS